MYEIGNAVRFRIKNSVSLVSADPPLFDYQESDSDVLGTGVIVGKEYEPETGGNHYLLQLMECKGDVSVHQNGVQDKSTVYVCEFEITGVLAEWFPISDEAVRENEE